MRVEFLILVLMVMLITVGLSVRAQDDTQASTTQDVHYNLKEGDGYSTEMPPPDKEASRKFVRADVTRLPGLRVSPQWVDAGTWTSDKLQDTFIAGSLQVRFNLWIRCTEGQNSGNTDFQFRLYVGDQQVAYAETSEDVGPDPVEVIATADLGNITQFMRGDTISYNVRTRAFFDNEILFDSRDYLSGLTMNSDPLKITMISGDKSGVSVFYSEAFGVEPFYKLMIDEETRQEKPTKGTSDNGKYYTWKIKLDVGTHTVKIKLSYLEFDNNPNQTAVWEATQTVTIKEVKESSFLGLPGFEAVPAMAAITGAILLVYRRMGGGSR